jgi:hypothetical protein
MKLSMLIRCLQKLHAKHGDIEAFVVSDPFDTITEVLHKSEYRKETALGNELPQEDFVALEHEPVTGKEEEEEDESF